MVFQVAAHSEGRRPPRPHERDQQDPPRGAHRGGHEGVLVGQHVGLRGDRGGQEPVRLLARQPGIGDMGAETAGVGGQPVRSQCRSPCDVLADDVGMELLPDRTKVCMKAVPISPPNRRLSCNRQPIVSASTGTMLRTSRTVSAVSAKDCPIACRIYDGRKSAVAQADVISAVMRQAAPTRAVPNARTYRPSTRRSSAAKGTTMAI